MANNDPKINDPTNGYQPVKVTSAHRQMIDLRLKGFTYTQIAQQLGQNPLTVSRVLRSPAVRKQLADEESKLRLTDALEMAESSSAVQKAREIFEEHAEAAALIKIELMSSSSDQIRLKAADDVLKHAGLGNDSNNGNVAVMVYNDFVEVVEGLRQRDKTKEIFNVKATDKSDAHSREGKCEQAGEDDVQGKERQSSEQADVPGQG